MNRLRILVVALIAALTAPAAAQVAGGTILVDGPWVTLGDITGTRGAAAGVRVAPAPAPGGRTVLNVTEVIDLAKKHGVAWDPRGLRGIAVERAATVVPREVILDAIGEELARRLPGRLLQPEILNANFALYVARDAVPSVRIENFDYDTVRGTFAATVVAPATGVDAQRVTVRGRVAELVLVPALLAPVAVGSVIRHGDVGWIEVRGERLAQGTATQVDQLVGQSPRRPIRANEPVRLSDVQTPVVVAKGSTVTMIVETPGIQLTAVGRALANAGLGEAVQVMNVQTHTTIEGVVEGPGRVRVSTRRPVQEATAR